MKKLLLIGFAVITVNSASGQWQLISSPADGSAGVGINYLAANGTDVFAATSGGFFLTANEGLSWIAADSGIIDNWISSIVFSDSNTFIGTRGGVYSTNNFGNSWTELNDGLQDTTVISLAVKGTEIFAGTFRQGIFLSTNNGNNWNPVSNGLPSAQITALVASDSVIFAGTNTGYIYVSNNDGTTWVDRDSGLPIYNAINSLIICNSNIIAGTNEGIYSSAINGLNWIPMNNGLGDTIVNVIATYGSAIFAGTDFGHVYLSANYGNNWIAIDSGLPLSHSDAFGDYYPASSLVVNDSIVYVGTYGDGVWQRSIADVLTGTQQISLTSPTFHLYPNPTNNNFIIETSNTGEQQLQVFDITGKLLLTRAIQNNKTTIDASSFAAGVYLVSLKSSEGTATQKLVIEK